MVEVLDSTRIRWPLEFAPKDFHLMRPRLIGSGWNPLTLPLVEDGSPEWRSTRALVKRWRTACTGFIYWRLGRGRTPSGEAPR